MLFWVLLIGLVLWLILRKHNTPTSLHSDVDVKLERRNYEWAQFIYGYKTKVKTKVEKHLIERMLSDISSQGLPIPNEIGDVPTEATVKPMYVATTAADQSSIASKENYLSGPDLVQRTSPPIDSAVLLLYFGAFLFLGAVGLFLAFGNLPGVAKSILVGLLVVVFYGSGQWLFRNSKRLKQGGLAFIGIGLVLLPFFGLSLHTDTFNSTNGPFIWGGTSLLAILLYYHALKTTRQAFITYSMLAAVVSLFESSVSIVNLPTYYFALGMAAASILFLLVSRLNKHMQDLQEQLVISANVLLPIALFMSLIYIPSQGILQLSFALLLSGAFYGVYAWLSEDRKRDVMFVWSNAFLLSGVGLVVFHFSDALEVLAPTLCILAALELLVLAAIRRSKSLTSRLFRWLMILTASLPLLACVFALGNASLLAATLLASVAFMVSIHTLTRDPSYITAAACLLFMWVAEMGLYWQQDLWSANDFIVAWMGLAVLFFGQRIRHLKQSPLGSIYRVNYIVALGLAVFCSVFSSWQVALGVMLATSFVCYLLSRYENRHSFVVSMLCLHYFAIIAGSFGFSNSIRVEVLALLFCALGILHYASGVLTQKSTQSRYYFSSGLIGTLLGTLTFTFGPGRTWPMLISLTIFSLVSWLEFRRLSSNELLVVSLVAQYIAVGWAASLLPDSLQPTTTPFLFLLLACLQYLASLFVLDNNRLLWSFASMTGLAIGAATGVVYTQTTIPMITNLVLLISVSYVESRRTSSRTLVAVSIVVQYILVLWLCLLQNYLPDNIILPSSFGLLAIVHYFLGTTLNTLPAVEKTVWIKSGLIGTALGSLFVIPFSETTLPMIFNLTVLGILVYLEAIKTAKQSFKELGLAICMTSFQWWLYYLGVREFQVYSHLWSITFAGFAVWRNSINDAEGEKLYTILALFVLSVPLLLAALGASGEIYGWLLITEHVLLMIIGIMVSRRYVMWWGLGVATVAVLYQLRDLAFAGLGFLAVVVIGVALYILNHQNKIKE